MKRLALVLMLLTAPAMAQEEAIDTVTVTGNVLTGVWYGGLLHFAAWDGFFGAPRAQFVADTFCRFAARKQDLEITCLQGGTSIARKTDATHIHIGWGLLNGGGFDGEMVSADHLRGRYRNRRWGVSYEDPSISNLDRVTPDPAAPDKAGKAALLRRILGDGLAGVPQDADAMKKNRAVFDPPQLGAVQAISYLGQETKWDNPPPGTKLDFDHLRLEDLPHYPDFFSVYLVNFAQGERLCSLHQRDDGVLDALNCV